jgi:hypothetical protein
MRDELCRLAELQMEPELRRDLIKNYILWKWTAGLKGETKYKGCTYWSGNALNRWRQNCENDVNDEFKGLRHEHIVPRAYLTDKLLALPQLRNSYMRAMLDDLCHGCVLTKEEDKFLKKNTMPHDWQPAMGIWARYADAFREIGIVIVRMEWPTGRENEQPEFEILAPRNP